MSQHGGFIRKRVVPVFIHEHYRFTSEFYFLKILYGILHYMRIKRSQSDETIPCHSSFCRLERGSCTGTWSSSSLRAMRNTPPGTTWLSLDHSVTLWSALFTRSNLIGSRGFVLFVRTTSVDDHYAFFVLFKAVLADLQNTSLQESVTALRFVFLAEFQKTEFSRRSWATTSTRLNRIRSNGRSKIPRSDSAEVVKF